MSTTSRKTSPRACLVTFARVDSGDPLLLQASTLRESGIAVRILCLGHGGPPPQEIPGPVDAHPLAVATSETRGWRLWWTNVKFTARACARLAVFLRGADGRIVQVDFSPNFLLGVALFTRLIGARLVWRMLDPWPERLAARFGGAYGKLAAKAATLMEGLVFALGHHTLVGTREMRELLGSKGLDIHKVAVVVTAPEDSIEHLSEQRFRLRDIAEIRKEERRKGAFNILAYCGSRETGGLDDVLAALRQLMDTVPGARLQVLGDAWGEAVVRQRASRYGVQDRVACLPAGAARAAAQELISADVAVVAMRRNAYTERILADPIFEFAALEKPVVLPGLAAMRSYFSEEAFLFYKPGDPMHLAQVIHSVFTQPEPAVRRAQKAFEWIEAYRWDREGKKYTAVFHDLL